MITVSVRELANGQYTYTSNGDGIAPVTRTSKVLRGYAAVNDAGQFTLHGKPLRTVQPGRFTVLVLGYGELSNCPRQTCTGTLNPATGRCPTCGATEPGMPA